MNTYALVHAFIYQNILFLVSWLFFFEKSRIDNINTWGSDHFNNNSYTMEF